MKKISSTTKISSKNDSGVHFESQEYIDNSVSLMELDEKSELVSLNDRLANYIDFIRKNDSNGKFLKSLEEISEIPSEQLSNLRSTYEAEIYSLRDALDQQSNELARLTIEKDKVRAENNNLRSDNEKKSNSIEELMDKLKKEQINVAQMKSRLAYLENLNKDHKTVEDQLKACKERLETEVMLRTAADNVSLTLRDKMKFNEEVFKKELGALLTSHRITLKKMETLQQGMNNSGLLEQMDISRQNLNKFLIEVRQTFNTEFLTRLDTAADKVRSAVKSAGNDREKQTEWKREIHELESQLAQIRASHELLERQLSQVNQHHSAEVERLRQLIQDLSSSGISDLEKMIERLSDFIGPVSQKVMLDSEIELYRHMLEGEESRTSRSFDVSENSYETLERFETTASGIPVVKKRRVETQKSTTQSIPTGRKIIQAKRKQQNCAIM